MKKALWWILEVFIYLWLLKLAASAGVVPLLGVAVIGGGLFVFRKEIRSKFRRRSGLCLLLVSLLALTACTLHGRIYNLRTGEVTPVTFTYGGSGRGRITAYVVSSGENLTGEYITYARIPLNWGSIYHQVYGANGYVSSNQGAWQQYGTAVVSGDHGFVGDCEYVTQSLTHGAGACLAKDGEMYKLMF